MENLIFVRLRDFGQTFSFSGVDLVLKEGDLVIVEYDRGLDYGRIVPDAQKSIDKGAPYKDKELPKKIMRLANDDDLKRVEENKIKAKDVFLVCVKRIKEHKLEMKLVRAEYSFDRSKIVFYFTAEGRVDFRDLVKDLAKIFKARIELRQIGVRDEAKFCGGFGPCDRELCCAKFLKDFEPVTIKMAKEEGLSLNPAKMSGLCGRLMCCLSFEYESYKTLSKGLPRPGERVHAQQGNGKVISINVFKRIATIELENGTYVEVSYK